MVKRSTDVLRGSIIDNDSRLTLRELCEACSVHVEFVIDLVNEGALEPAGYERSHWCFTGHSMKRVRTAWRLRQDLGINTAGIALALDLLEEVDRLHARLARATVPHDD